MAAAGDHEGKPEGSDSDDEVKRKFREALNRKNAAQADKKAAGGPKDSSKVHGTHGPEGGKRTFRRKAGG
jgi:hypothetical protein